MSAAAAFPGHGTVQTTNAVSTVRVEARSASFTSSHSGRTLFGATVAKSVAYPL